MDVVEQPIVKDNIGINDKSEIILHNDNANTFAYVVACLVRYCNHTAEQAEQCAFITHYNGKCSVKVGDYIDLLPIHTALSERKLIVEIKK